MFWVFTCSDGTIWEPDGAMSLVEALEQFTNLTGLSDLDIRTIVNKH